MKITPNKYFSKVLSGRPYCMFDLLVKSLSDTMMCIQKMPAVYDTFSTPTCGLYKVLPYFSYQLMRKWMMEFRVYLTLDFNDAQVEIKLT